MRQQARRCAEAYCDLPRDRTARIIVPESSATRRHRRDTAQSRGARTAAERLTPHLDGDKENVALRVIFL